MSKASEKLRDELKKGNYILLSRNLIRAIGIQEAVLISDLLNREEYFEETDGLTEDGFFYRRQKDLKRDTGLSEKTQRRLISKLGEKKVIEVSLRGNPARNYYRINHGEILSLLTCAHGDHEHESHGKSRNSRKRWTGSPQKSMHDNNREKEQKHESGSLMQAVKSSSLPHDPDNRKELAALEALRDAGIFPSTARRLLNEKGINLCQRAIKLLPWWIADYEKRGREVRDRAAFLKTAIEEEWEEPDSLRYRLELEELNEKIKFADEKRKEKDMADALKSRRMFESLTENQKREFWNWICRKFTGFATILGDYVPWEEMNELQRGFCIGSIDAWFEEWLTKEDNLKNPQKPHRESLPV